VTFHTAAPVAVFAVILCAAAGTARYGLAWAYLGTHLLTMTATNVYFLRTSPETLERRLAMVERGERERPQRWILALVAASTLAILVVAGLDRRNGWSSVPPWVLAFAYVVMCAGIAVLFAVMRANAFASSVIEIGEGQRVVDTGPYAVVRHPMYVGFLLVGVATPLALGSYGAALPVAALAAAIAARLHAEERFLAEHLPGYAEYMRRTKYRLVPGLY
jgi:protein-S-isoprenylcysteine O-methyltransferase Ste14